MEMMAPLSENQSTKMPESPTTMPSVTEMPRSSPPSLPSTDNAAKTRRKEKRRSGEGSGKHNLGLSELSKQLRILQNQNKVQQIEIDRLERQLKLLADLQNVSVGDLRSALLKACQGEAHAELQRTVASLKAQLQAATLANQKGTSIKEVSASNDIANLQLRLGEMEEVEDGQKAEIKKLYAYLAKEKERAARFKAKCASQRSEMEQMKAQAEREKLEVDDFMKQLKDYQAKLAFMESTVRLQQNELDEWAALGKRLKASQDDKNSIMEMQRSEADEAHMKQMRDRLQAERESNKKLENAIRAAKFDISALRDEANRAKMFEAKSRSDADLEVQICKEKVGVLEDQLTATNEKYKLRNDQFKARFALQGERIQDLEQQLSSLYVAFELLKNDRSAEDATREALRANLATADATVAQQVEEMEKKKRGGAHRSQLTPTPPAPPSPSTFAATRMATAAAAAASPVGNEQARVDAPGLSSPPVSARAPAQTTPSSTRSPSPARSPTNASESPQGHNKLVMTGQILLRTSGMVKQWKKRTASLYQSDSRYKLVVFADESSKQKVFSAPIGVSRVEQFPRQQFGFQIHINPRNANAPVVCAAALNDDQYNEWISGLMFATNTKSNRQAASASGPRSQPSPEPAQGSQTPTRPSPVQTRSPMRSPSASSRGRQRPMTPAEQEQRDLELALRLSAQT